MTFANLFVLLFAFSIMSTIFYLVNWYFNEVVKTDDDRVGLNTNVRLHASMLRKMPKRKVMRW